ncbi:hypothetical protein [Paenimyroides baculatum]|uniref:Uncharacterized protein n=1 Tax=Paenimyroides baculatum TaxID=2608000 RepID=A0A5M6CIV0_9FLAO|nr:hypothetical protein [Paenimyroides baculatum]KAA5533882.1 hypothetical protein F0460_11140 [Paenimyroides baculatum]
MKSYNKFKRLFPFIVLIILVLIFFAYLNTYIKQKYEVQLHGIVKNIDENVVNAGMRRLKNERIFLIGFSISLIIIAVVIVYKDDKK